jgi:hypothetical protein
MGRENFRTKKSLVKLYYKTAAGKIITCSIREIADRCEVTIGTLTDEGPQEHGETTRSNRCCGKWDRCVLKWRTSSTRRNQAADFFPAGDYRTDAACDPR